MRDAFECPVAFGEQKFPAPDGSVQTVAGSVPNHTQGWPFDLILRHACDDVRPVMLDADFGKARLTVTGGQGTARHTYYFVRMFGRKIIRMHIARHEVDIRIVQSWQIGARPAKRSVSLFRFQIADVLADKNVAIDFECDGVL